MLFSVDFKIDQFILRNAKDASHTEKLFHEEQARILGLRIMEAFPFTLDREKTYSGTLPAASLTKDHEYQNFYKRNLCVYDLGTIEKILLELRSDNPDLFTISKLLDHEHISLAGNTANGSLSDDRIL